MLAPGVGGLVLLAWAVVLVAVGYVMTRSRDVA
jgi:hypothetical protein